MGSTGIWVMTSLCITRADSARTPSAAVQLPDLGQVLALTSSFLICKMGQ